MADTVKILIDINSRLQGLEQTVKGLDQTAASAKAAGGALQNAFAIDLVSRFNAGLASIPSALLESVKAGVQFNATIQDATLGVAAVLKQFNPAQFATFDAALGKSAEAIDLLKIKAAQSPATFEQLVGAFQGISGAASAANIPLKKQVDLVVLLSQGLAGLGIRSDQILQEGRALITGNITEDAAAARILGISKADIDAAKESGQLFEFLSDKLSAFSEAGVRGAQGYTTALSNLEDVLTQLKGEAFAPVFEALRVGVLGLNDVLSKADTVNAFRGVGETVASVAKEVLELTQFMLRHADVVKTVGEVLATVAIGYAAVRLTERALQWASNTLAVAANTVALEQNAAAAMAAAASQGRAAAMGALQKKSAYAASPDTFFMRGPASVQGAAQLASAASAPGMWAGVGTLIGNNIVPVLVAATVGWQIGQHIAEGYIDGLKAKNAATNAIIDASQKARQELLTEARKGELTADQARLGVQKQVQQLLSEESDTRRELANTLLPAARQELQHQLEEIINQRNNWEQIGRNLESIVGSEREAVAAALESAQAAKEREQIEASTAAFKKANADVDLNLQKARASGNQQLITQAEHEKAIADAIADAERLGMTALGQKTKYAETIVGLREQELALATRLKNVDLAESIGMGSDNTRLATIQAKKARIQRELSATPKSGGPRVKASAGGGGKFAGPVESSEPLADVPPLPDDVGGGVLPPMGALPEVKQQFGRFDVVKGGDDGNLRREQSTQRRLELQRELQQVQQQEAAEVQRLADLEAKNVQFGRESLATEELKRDPLGKTLSDTERLAFLAERKTALEKEYAPLVEQGKRTSQEVAKMAEEKAAAEWDAKVAASASREVHTDDKRELKALKEEYQEIAQLISSIEGSSLLPAGEKRRQVAGLRDKLRDNLDAQSAQGEDTRAEKSKLDSQSRKDQQEGSFGGQFEGQFTQWSESLGTAGESAATMLTDTLGVAMEGLSDSLVGLINGTNDWNKVWKTAGQSALKSVLDLTLKTVAHYAIIEPLAAAFHAATEGRKAAATGTTVAQEGVKAAAGSVAGAALSISSFGVAAIVGIAAFLAAKAVGGFAEGGYTGDGGKYEVAGTVHRGEYVVPAHAVDKLGVGYLDSLTVNAGRGYAGGGAVDTALSAPASERRGGVTVMVVHSEEDLRRVVNEHPDTEHKIVRTMAANRGRAGL